MAGRILANEVCARGSDGWFPCVEMADTAIKILIELDQSRLISAKKRDSAMNGWID
jgi:hypothetical protein